MTVNAIERENVRLATDNRRLRLENARLTQVLCEIEADAENGQTPAILPLISHKIQRAFRTLPVIGE